VTADLIYNLHKTISAVVRAAVSLLSDGSGWEHRLADEMAIASAAMGILFIMHRFNLIINRVIAGYNAAFTFLAKL
jgi:hypothetical protein